MSNLTFKQDILLKKQPQAGWKNVIDMYDALVWHDRDNKESDPSSSKEIGSYAKHSKYSKKPSWKNNRFRRKGRAGVMEKEKRQA